jgi:hypothetical protein
VPNLSLFKIPEAILTHAKRLIVAGETIAPPTGTKDTSFPPRPDAQSDKDTAPLDAAFWISVAAVDRRLAALRRAIDQAAAEAAACEAAPEAPPSLDPNFGESRCKMANRVITDALDAKTS